MSFPADFLAPIPAPPYEDWAAVPPPTDCGEGLLDPTALSSKIAYLGSYRLQGLPGAMERPLLRETVARKLAQVADVLPEGWSLLIFDALRPLSVQRAIYDDFKARFLREDPTLSPERLEALLDDFVAKPVRRPHRPAPHATGGAVDLTLCRDGVPLDMGTGFDDLTDLAHTRALEEHCPPSLEQARDHRRLLYHLMEGVGMVNYACEWWHYAYGERQWAVRTGKAPFYGFLDLCDN